VGKAFVTRLGKHGRRVSICFGPRFLPPSVSRGGAEPSRSASPRPSSSNERRDVRAEFAEDGETYLSTA